MSTGSKKRQSKGRKSSNEEGLFGSSFWQREILLPQPPRFESLANDGKIISDNELFDGFKLDVQHVIEASQTKQFAWATNVVLGAAEENHNLGIGLVYDNATSYAEDDGKSTVGWGMQGSADKMGKVGGALSFTSRAAQKNLENKYDRNTGFRVVFQAQSTPPDSENPGTGFVIDSEYSAKETNFGIRYQAPNTFIFQMVQAIWNKLAFGMEYVTNFSTGSMYSFGFRWSGRVNQFGATVRGPNVQLQHRTSLTSAGFSSLFLTSEFMTQATPQGLDSHYIVGLAKAFPSTNALLRAQFNSNGRWSVFSEQEIAFMKIAYCFDLNFNKDLYKFGLGLTAGL